MTDLAVPEQTTAVATTGNNPPAQQQSALMVWAEEARVISNLAVSISKTAFAGQSRGKPEEVTAIILAGHELGFKPMAALKAFDIIQGTPALRAHAMRGLIQSKGHKIQLLESDATHCVMRGRRADEEWQTVRWDMPRAALMGLVGKGEWKKQPTTMLVARATGELCRLIASDALHGVPYTAEELRDSDTTTYDIQAAAPSLSVAAITAAPVAAPTPIAEPAVEPDVTDAETDHAAAVADLRAFGAANGVDDVDGEAFNALGTSLEDASPQAIRALLAQLTGTAA